MKVHEIVHYAALQVVLDAVDDDLSTDVHDLEISEVILILVLVDGLVDLLVVADAVAEIQRGLLGVLALIIRASGLNVPNIGHDELLVVALGLDKDDFDALLFEEFEDPHATLLGAIRCIEDTNYALLVLEPS